MAMTPAKRHQIRAKQEAKQEKRKDLDLLKKQQRKREENNFFPPQKKIKKKLKKVLTFDPINVIINM